MTVNSVLLTTVSTKYMVVASELTPPNTVAENITAVPGPNCVVLAQVMILVPAVVAVQVIAVPTTSVCRAYTLKLYVTSVTP